MIHMGLVYKLCLIVTVAHYDNIFVDAYLIVKMVHFPSFCSFVSSSRIIVIYFRLYWGDVAEAGGPAAAPAALWLCLYLIPVILSAGECCMSDHLSTTNPPGICCVKLSSVTFFYSFDSLF